MSKFTFGEYKGEPFGEADPQYLLWVWNTFASLSVDYPELYAHIKEDLDDIRELADAEEAEFLREWCDGEVSTEF